MQNISLECDKITWEKGQNVNRVRHISYNFVHCYRMVQIVRPGLLMDEPTTSIADHVIFRPHRNVSASAV